LWAAFGFLAGVLAHAVQPLSPSSTWMWGGALGLGALSFILASGRKIWSTVGLLSVAFGFGLVRFDQTLPHGANDLGRFEGSSVVFIGRVADVRQYDVILNVEKLEGSSESVSGRISFTPVWSREVGERVRVTCNVVTSAKSTDRLTLMQTRQGVFERCRGASQITRLSGPGQWDVIALLVKWRGVVSKRISSIMPGDEGALLAGILYGERGLSPEAATSFRNAGMTHIIAVSGSNITIVVTALVPLMLALGYRRRTAHVLSGVGILTFVFFVGASASVVRAAIMGWIALLARVFGRKADATRLLVIAAACIVALDPWALAFDAGFALSFLATWGLIAWSRPLGEHLSWIPDRFGLRDIAATTTAATLVTAPYSLWAFQRTSLAGLVTNLFALPLVGFVMVWGTVAIAVASFIPWIVLPAQGALRVMLEVAYASNALPWLRFTLALPTWGLFSVYGVLVLVWMLYAAKNRSFPQLPRVHSKKSVISNKLVSAR
jgi:competence protein ComEC